MGIGFAVLLPATLLTLYISSQLEVKLWFIVIIHFRNMESHPLDGIPQCFTLKNSEKGDVGMKKH